MTAPQAWDEIDPWPALHPTTVLALEFLDRHVRTGSRVLDVGAGDGVLADCARALGGEPVALELRLGVARGAAKRGLSTVAGRAGSVRAGAFDLVVANVWPDELLPDAEDLAASLAPEGRLYLTGLPLYRASGMMRFFPGLQLARRDARRGWAGLELTHA